MKGEKGHGMRTTFKWFRKVNYTHICISFSSAAQSCPTPHDPMDCSMPGFPVYRQLLELAQTNIHGSGDAIQPSHPLLSPSPTFNLSQPQRLFQWVASSQQVAQVLEFSASASVLSMNIQYWFPLGLTGWISLQSKGNLYLYIYCSHHVCMYLSVIYLPIYVYIFYLSRMIKKMCQNVKFNESG